MQVVNTCKPCRKKFIYQETQTTSISVHWNKDKLLPSGRNTPGCCGGFFLLSRHKASKDSGDGFWLITAMCNLLRNKVSKSLACLI